MEKSGGGATGLTTKVTVVVCVSNPLVPVIDSKYDPATVLDVVLTVSVEAPEPVTDVGLKPAVVPAGNPLTLSPTEPLNPFKAPTLTVYGLEHPTVTPC